VALHLRELRQRLALRERERSAELAAFAGCTRLLERQRRIAAAGAGSRAAWAEHLERTDELRAELARRGRRSDAFAAAAAASFETFLAAPHDAEGHEARDSVRIELEADPGFRA
jgi:hypothetical protein